METKTIHSNNISFVEVLAALVEFFTLCALFIVQGTAKTAKTAGKVSRIAWRWLNVRHAHGLAISGSWGGCNRFLSPVRD